MIDIYQILNNNRYKNILVFGDLIVDSYVEVDTQRISSEFPIPVYEKHNNKKINLGGAGNVLNNLKEFGCNPILISIVDKNYENKLIDTSNLINIEDSEYKNSVKTRYYSNNYQCFRLDDKLSYTMSNETIEKFKKKFNEILDNKRVFEYVIISDYNTGIINPELTKYLIELCNKNNVKTLVDPKNYYDIYKNCTVIKPNKNDAEKFCNFKINSIEDAYRACDIFIEKLNVQLCIITLSEKGSVYKSKFGKKDHIPCPIIDDEHLLDVTGAGDTFISTFTVVLDYLDYTDCCKLCNIFCNDVIKKQHVSPPNLFNVLKENFNIIDFTKDEKLKSSLNSLQKVDNNNCSVLKRYLGNSKLIFTSGCFDLVHEGHIDVLRKAKSLGGILIVALNSDESITRLKGEGRPINNLDTRLSVLSAIKYIDFIIIFSEETPNHIFEILEPDILVKGGDYSYDVIKKIFPKVKMYESVPLINNISSTNIINKIQNSKSFDSLTI